MQANLDTVNEKLEAFYRSTREPHVMPPILISNLTDSRRSWPMLHGRAIKASNTRALVPFLVSLCIETDIGGDPVKLHRRRAIEHLREFYSIVYGHGEFLPHEQGLAMKHNVFKFLHHYVWLHNDALAKHKILWAITAKFHYFFHVALRCHWINPRWQQTYVDESMVGRICKLYRGCSNGPYHASVQKVALVKYLTALHILLGRRAGL